MEEPERREALQERYKEKKKGITEANRRTMVHIHTHICVHISCLPLLKGCQRIDKPRHCILRAANQSSPLQTPVKPAVSGFNVVRLGEITEHGFITMLHIHVPCIHSVPSPCHLIYTRPIYTAFPILTPLHLPHHSPQPSSSPTS